MTFVSQLLWTVVGIVIYVSPTSFLNQPIIYRAIFPSFGQAVCTQRTLPQKSEVWTTAVQMSTVRHESKPIPSLQCNYLPSLLFPYRFSVKRSLLQHSGCLCLLYHVATIPVHRHLSYQYATIPNSYCALECESL
jgi:hypothetical protein